MNVVSIPWARESQSAVRLYARPTSGYGERVGHALRVLQEAAAQHPGRIVQASSLGAEDMVITDLVARNRLGVGLATLDTGKLHRESLELLSRIRLHYGIEIDVFRPQAAAVAAFVAQHGEEAMYRGIALRKGCCEIRKVEPLSRMLAGRTAWVTGLRREQSAQREVVAFAIQDPQGRLKVNPLADWTWADVWQYIGDNDVPYNPLHDRFHPSIGCEPCTRAIAAGEDLRAGRWWWEGEEAKECGLHVAPGCAAAGVAS